MAETKTTMSSQATIDENGESKLVYYRDDDAIHTGQDSGGTIINFNNGDIDGDIVNFSTFLSKIISGISLKKFLADFKEACNYVLNTEDVEDSLTSNSSTDVLSARMGKILDSYLSLYASITEESTLELTFASAIPALLTGVTLVNNRSYPCMIDISGTTFNGSYTGVINKTASSITFLVSCEEKTYAGIYANNSATVIKLAEQSDIDAINTRLNFNATLTVSSNSWLADTSNGGYYQTLNVASVTSGMSLLIDVYNDGVDAETFAGQVEAFSDWASSGWAVAGNGTVTLHCYEAPEANFIIMLTEK